MYKKLLDLKIQEEIQDVDLGSLIHLITEMRNKEYWKAKDERLNLLTSNKEVAYYLLYHTAGITQSIQELVSKLLFLSSGRIDQKIRNVSDVVECCNGIHYNIKLKPIRVESIYEMEQETYEFIALDKYPPPLVQEPREWTSNNSGGYYTTDSSCILGSKFNHHEQYQALDCLNKIQRIPLMLDPVILDQQELPNELYEGFDQLAAESRQLYEKYKNKPFWFEWKFDKRGRMYSSGYHINFQSYSFKRSLISLEKKELL